VPATGRDEVAELTVAFNEMSLRLRQDADEIARKNSEIEGFNRDLQRRVDEAIAKAMGQGTKGRMGRGWGNLASGMRQAFIGSPNKSRKEDDGSVVVGGEKFSPEEMKQWRDARSQLKAPEQPAPAQQAQAPQPPQVPQAPQQPAQAQATAQQAPRKRSKESLEWEQLMNQYRASRDRGEKNQIQATMAMRYPRRYKVALDRAREMQARHRSGQARVQTT
jgi:hypothetical protein